MRILNALLALACVAIFQPAVAGGLTDKGRIYINKNTVNGLPEGHASLGPFATSGDTDVRVTVGLDIGMEYDAFKMGADEKYESEIHTASLRVLTHLQQTIKHQGLDQDIRLEPWTGPLPWVAATVNRKGIDALIDSPDILQIEGDIIMEPFLSGTLGQMSVSSLHSTGATGSGKSVAIVDSGIDVNHPMFIGKIAGEVCFATKYGSGHDACPGPRGSTSVGSGAACTNTNPDCNHGTHVAGIAIGSSQAWSGHVLKGVAPTASVVSVRIASAKINAAGSGPGIVYSALDMIDAFSYLYANRSSLNLASINLSAGNINAAGLAANSTCDSIMTPMTSAIALLTGAGIPVVIAAGTFNPTMTVGGVLISSEAHYAGKVAFPACVGNAVKISSVDRNNKFVNESSASSSIIDLLAPGGDPFGIPTDSILSSLLGSTYGYKGGTSMAAPHVAGAFAAFKSGPWTTPGLTVAQMVNHLKSTGTSVTKNMDGSWAAYSHKMPSFSAALVAPSAPTTFNVTPMFCYGDNSMDWSGSSGTVTNYELQGSATSGFTSPYHITANAGASVTVSSKTWLRIRACNGPSCGAWKTGSQPATYTVGCI